MNMNAAIVAITCLSVCIGSACDKKSEQTQTTSTGREDIGLSWYNGYKMPELLAEPIKPTDAKDLVEVNKRKWYAETQVYDEAVPGKIIPLSSCESYQTLSSLRLRAVQEQENIALMEILMMCKATQLMLTATRVEKSFLHDVKLDQTLPSLLPATLALVTSATERTRISKDKSIKFWKDVNKQINVDALGPFHVNYQHVAGMQELELVARGDFNGDNIEDMLITSRDSVKGGTYSAIRLFVLTKNSSAGEIVVKEFTF